MRTRQKQCVATDTWRSLGCRTTQLEHWSKRKPKLNPGGPSNSKLSLMGRHHLLLLSHLAFHRVQCLDLSCSWYISMTCPQDFPLQYDFLLMNVYCTESYETNRMQSHYRQILIIYRNGKENCKWSLTRTSANISESPTSEMSYIPATFMDRH